MPRYVVRCGSMRSLYVLSSSKGDTYSRNARVIGRTDRGTEAGEVLCVATDEALEQFSSSGGGQILRQMNGDDERQLESTHEKAAEEFRLCERYIQVGKLAMQLVDVEHLFGGERIVFFYLAENRVDFRELVKALASELQTRIEMRQIGIRDEAKLLADYGDCGKPVCCGTHLTQMPPVSMKMAKLQKATLDPTKISGRCGRLKCCLRYEYDTYTELKKELPPVGAHVVTNSGRARVVAQELLASQLLVELEDRRRVMIESADVLSVLKKDTKETKASTTSGDQG